MLLQGVTGSPVPHFPANENNRVAIDGSKVSPSKALAVGNDPEKEELGSIPAGLNSKRRKFVNLDAKSAVDQAKVLMLTSSGSKVVSLI